MQRTTPAAALRAATLSVLLTAAALLLTACGQGSTTAPAATAVPAAAIAPTTPDTAPDTGTTTGGAAAPEATTTTAPAGQDSSAELPQSGMDLTKVDPCVLLTKEDVAGAMGDVPFAPKPQTQNELHTACSYVEPTLEVNSPRLFLSLDPVEMWDYHQPDVQPVTGVGDEAFSQDFDGWRTVSVLVKNKVIVRVDIYPPDTEKATSMIRKAIERLP